MQEGTRGLQVLRPKEDSYSDLTPLPPAYSDQVSQGSPDVMRAINDLTRAFNNFASDTAGRVKEIRDDMSAYRERLGAVEVDHLAMKGACSLHANISEELTAIRKENKTIIAGVAKLEGRTEGLAKKGLQIGGAGSLIYMIVEIIKTISQGIH
jgi:hypothetical protein